MEYDTPRRISLTQLTEFKNNCLLEIFFDEAIARAKELDEHLGRTGKTVGPLHGLPISIKDNFKIRGHPSSVGFTARANEPMEEDSLLIDVLRKAGAVLYVKTNVPVAMQMAEAGLVSRYHLTPADLQPSLGSNAPSCEPTAHARRFIRWRGGSNYALWLSSRRDD